jgi:hypothetical protein
MSDDDARLWFDALWEELVPASGEAASVQGEVVRCIGRLRSEAWRNGNANWDSEFEAMCRFVATTLAEDSALDAAEESALNRSIERVLDYDDPDTEDDGAFLSLMRLAVAWCRRNPELVPLGPGGQSQTGSPAAGRIRTFSGKKPVHEPYWRPTPPRDDQRVREYALSGDVVALGALLEQGASVDSISPSFETALHHAVEEGNVEVVRLLLEHDASVNLQDWVGRTPLHYAVAKQRFPIVKALLKAGADPNVHDAWGATPLHDAVGPRATEEVALLLLEHGADPNATMRDGRTPAALEAPFSEGVRRLIRARASGRGADPGTPATS